MKCIHCGKEIESDSRFCTFCGGENQPRNANPAQPPESTWDELPDDVAWVQEPRPEMHHPPARQAPPQPVAWPMPPVSYPQPQKQKKGGTWKWVVAFVWLALVIAGWAAALLLLQPHPSQAVANGEAVWYQWDLGSDTLYCWTFREDGMAEYGVPGKNERSTVEYSVDDSGSLHIGYDGAAVWVYDSVEDCYWQYSALDGEIYKTRIFRSTEYPAGNALCYSYRTNDAVFVPVPSVSYENITKMNEDAVQELLNRYDHYGAFGACIGMESVYGQEAEEVLRSAGYAPTDYSLHRVHCCNSYAQSREHLAHYLSDDILNGKYRPVTIPIEYNGKLYMAVTPTGFAKYYVDGQIIDLGNGKWSVPLRIEDEGDIFRGYSAIFFKEGGTIKLLGIETPNTVAGMSEWDAQEILNWYNQYESFGACCRTENVSQEIAQAVLKSAGYDSQYLDMYGVSRVVCCHSLSQSREHLSHYLGEDILNSQNPYEARPIEYNGGLYTVAAPMGYPGYYMDGSLSNQGEGIWTVPVKFDYEDTRYTAFFKLEDGEYKLISIEEAGGPVLTEDAAWELIDRAYFDNLLGYFYEDGIVDETDVYHIYPHPGDPTHAVACPSVSGVDSEEELRQRLRRHYTARRAEEIVQGSQVSREEADSGMEGWFSHEGTIYFVPNWGRGGQMLFREGMTVTQTGENAWTVSVAMEFTDERIEFHIVYEGGVFKIDV